MINLEKASGLPISFEYDKLTFGDGIAKPYPEAQARAFSELKPYLADPEARGLDPVYLIYRGVALNGDRELFLKNNLRYDITIIPPGRLGREFPKTIGHTHVLKPGTAISYPEIYEILHGRAYFLLQYIKDDAAGITYLIKAKAGEKVIVPSGFGHITINPGSEPLIVADIFAQGVTSIYDFFKNRHGAAYYVIDPKTVKSQGQEFVKDGVAFGKNGSYRKFGDLRIAKPKEIPELGADFKTPLYLNFKNKPACLAFLNYPEKSEKILKPENLFQIAD